MLLFPLDIPNLPPLFDGIPPTLLTVTHVFTCFYIVSDARKRRRLKSRKRRTLPPDNFVVEKKTAAVLHI